MRLSCRKFYPRSRRLSAVYIGRPRVRVSEYSDIKFGNFRVFINNTVSICRLLFGVSIIFVHNVHYNYYYLRDDDDDDDDDDDVKYINLLGLGIA